MAKRTAADAELTRQALVAAGARLFVQHGYADTSTTAISEAAGVTRGALYHHFADKRSLFRAVFVALEEELNDTVVAAATAAGDDALEAFLAGCRAALVFSGRPDYQRIAVADGPAVLGMADWHAIDTDIGLASMEAGLAMLHLAGVLSSPPSRPLAVLLFGALTEAGLLLARGDGSVSVDEVIAELARLIVR